MLPLYAALPKTLDYCIKVGFENIMLIVTSSPLAINYESLLWPFINKISGRRKSVKKIILKSIVLQKRQYNKLKSVIMQKKGFKMSFKWGDSAEKGVTSFKRRNNAKNALLHASGY